MEGQLSIYDFLDINNPQVPPEVKHPFDHEVHKALDVYFSAFPDTPVYFVTKKMGKYSPLIYKALICTYTGWWHGLQGWNIDNNAIESWELIPNCVVSDFIGKGGRIKLAWTPEEYEEIKDWTVTELFEEGAIRQDYCMNCIYGVRRSDFDLELHGKWAYRINCTKHNEYKQVCHSCDHWEKNYKRGDTNK